MHHDPHAHLQNAKYGFGMPKVHRVKVLSHTLLLDTPRHSLTHTLLNLLAAAREDDADVLLVLLVLLLDTVAAGAVAACER